MITVKVNYAGIVAMARDLARYSAQAYDNVLRLETASIIKICALNARPASVAAIKRSVTMHAEHNYVSPDESIVSINSTKNTGRTWFAAADIRANPERHYRSGNGKTSVWFMVFAAGHGQGWHLPDFYWQAYLLATHDREGYVKARIAELQKRRGLQLLSWLQIGDQLGVPLSTVSPSGTLREDLARGARGPKGATYSNGSALVRTVGSRLLITVTNRSPIAGKRQGQAALDRAINQRVKGFEIAMRKGVLADLKLRATRWKGIFVTGG